MFQRGKFKYFGLFLIFCFGLEATVFAQQYYSERPDIRRLRAVPAPADRVVPSKNVPPYFFGPDFVALKKPEPKAGVTDQNGFDTISETNTADDQDRLNDFDDLEDLYGHDEEKLPPQIIDIALLERQATQFIKPIEKVNAWGGISPKEVDNIHGALLLTAAQILAFYFDYEIYFLGPDGEVFYDLLMAILKTKGTTARLHLIPFSRSLAKDPNYIHYLEQEGISLSALKAGKKFVFVEVGDKFAAQQLLSYLFETPRIRDQVAAYFPAKYQYRFNRFSVKQLPNYPLGHVNLGWEWIRKYGGNFEAYDTALLKSPVFTWIPKKVKKVGHRWEIACSFSAKFPSDYRKTDESLALQKMRDLAHVASKYRAWFRRVALFFTDVRDALVSGKPAIEGNWADWIDLREHLMMDSHRMLSQQVRLDAQSQFLQTYAHTHAGGTSIPAKMWRNWARDVSVDWMDRSQKGQELWALEVEKIKSLRLLEGPAGPEVPEVPVEPEILMIEQNNGVQVTGKTSNRAKTPLESADSQ